MALLSFPKMPPSMVTLFIKPPAHASHLPGLERGSHATVSRRRRRKGGEKKPYCATVPSQAKTGSSLHKVDLFSNASLPVRYLSTPSSPPRFKHLVKRAALQETFPHLALGAGPMFLNRWWWLAILYIPEYPA